MSSPALRQVIVVLACLAELGDAQAGIKGGVAFSALMGAWRYYESDVEVHKSAGGMAPEQMMAPRPLTPRERGRLRLLANRMLGALDKAEGGKSMPLEEWEHLVENVCAAGSTKLRAAEATASGSDLVVLWTGAIVRSAILLRDVVFHGIQRPAIWLRDAFAHLAASSGLTSLLPPAAAAIHGAIQATTSLGNNVTASLTKLRGFETAQDQLAALRAKATSFGSNATASLKQTVQEQFAAVSLQLQARLPNLPTEQFAAVSLQLQARLPNLPTVQSLPTAEVKHYFSVAHARIRSVAELVLDDFLDSFPEHSVSLRGRDPVLVSVLLIVFAVVALRVAAALVGRAAFWRRRKDFSDLSMVREIGRRKDPWRKEDPPASDSKKIFARSLSEGIRGIISQRSKAEPAPPTANLAPTPASSKPLPLPLVPPLPDTFHEPDEGRPPPPVPLPEKSNGESTAAKPDWQPQWLKALGPNSSRNDVLPPDIDPKRGRPIAPSPPPREKAWSLLDAFSPAPQKTAEGASTEGTVAQADNIAPRSLRELVRALSPRERSPESPRDLQEAKERLAAMAEEKNRLKTEIDLLSRPLEAAAETVLTTRRKLLMVQVN
eukprot:gnl/TRDRNA2_/TRDRNA2_44333_c0_seq1.p1 gnl/TRDRNA2_/TRDRNA2_44333_c0~~gnl/TRDRNA2_/TRDRNA2_44333_c0_seq1.p1  ORF type:complete len:605 (+),score=124.42 gnl/TRDRNA2_/TRDRNA2_44333_c0_seq1:49-1863(+)